MATRKKPFRHHLGNPQPQPDSANPVESPACLPFPGRVLLPRSYRYKDREFPNGNISEPRAALHAVRGKSIGRNPPQTFPSRRAEFPPHDIAPLPCGPGIVRTLPLLSVSKAVTKPSIVRRHHYFCACGKSPDGWRSCCKCYRDKSANTASPARRPLVIAPWIDALSRWSPQTYTPGRTRTGRCGGSNAPGNCCGCACTR
jgi:hypothetical protein